MRDIILKMRYNLYMRYNFNIRHNLSMQQYFNTLSLLIEIIQFKLFLIYILRFANFQSIFFLVSLSCSKY